MAETQWRLLSRNFGGAAAEPTSIVIDADNDGAGAVLQATKAGTITHIGYYSSGKTLSPTFKVRMEQVTAPLPNGTIWDTGTEADSVPEDGGWQWVELDSLTAGVVTAGQYFAAVVTGKTGSVDASNYATVRTSHPCGEAQVFPFGATLTAGTWAVGSLLPAVGAKYSDGEVVLGSATCAAWTRSNNLNSTTTPDSLGTSWVAEHDGLVHGCRASIALLTRAASGTVHLYSGTGATPTLVGSGPFNLDVARSDYFEGIFLVGLPELAIVKDTTYHLVFTPVDSSSMRLIELTFDSAADRMAMCGPGARTERSGGAGAFTVTPTKAVSVYPIISDVTVSAGGGGLLVHPGMDGRFNG